MWSSSVGGDSETEVVRQPNSNPTSQASGLDKSALTT